MIQIDNQEHFSENEWLEVGILTEGSSVVNCHPRLLRSLSFSDDDYPSCVLSVLSSIVDLDHGNLRIIEDYVAERFPPEELNVSSDPQEERAVVFTPRVFSIPKDPVNRRLVSIMMPFDITFNPVYGSIKAAIDDEKLSCVRADNVWEHSTVIQDIFSIIFRSFITVCDFTGRNPNVFYEAGIAHTLGKHVIPIAQSAADIPFDLQQHRYLRYLNNNEGREKLRSELAQRLRFLKASQ